IPKEAMPHLFDPFFTTKSKTKGSGLGLSTVYAILERSGGGVRVISEPSMVGSAFHVYLPCTSKEAAPPDTSAEKRQDQGKTEKPRGEETGEEILVMAADAGLRRNITGILENRGYAVLEACDSMSALGQVRKLAKAPFLVILDTTDPDGNAIGLAEKLLAEHENLKVIFLVENIGSTRLPAAMPADRIRMVDNRLEPQRLFEIVREMTMAVPA
ncbi:MAG: hybrid sensor histidine kinase/response regulator, partial [Fibrobacteres bacterium]|nr:hybrid sensor histidine kinase/response regulator [Fibrobacterota bacterium]